MKIFISYGHNDHTPLVNALYDALSTAGNNLAVLLEDLKAHPMRYVHFSLFGQSEEKIAQKAAKKAAREQKRAAKAAN